ncbi:nucleotide-binding universal stress UspA family protein [Winogradskyella wandonensis]|uniref:Nucleotide-binding universal stress UspA family protein n=1 Tax=Winogradskyella wandonensis TaxID=1442586 RepID=A0A4R1KX06_9FLAO|nr:universal stress protein [Winogradskyella wandonensis]TCK68869.1 nucleotide-binding universal stress UspA family protein [Winogradskyella wandonensis]
MKKILVPVDFSEHSENALETAAAIAKKHGSELYVLHMLELSNAIYTASTAALNEEGVFYFKLAEKKMNTFLDRNFLDGVDVTPVIKHFKVFKEINEVINAHQIDLVVMGSHGTSGVKDVIIGSNAERVVRYSEVPVLIVKHNPILVEFNTGIFASDFSEDAIEAYLRAKATFKKLDSKMHLIYVNTPDNGFKSSTEIDVLVTKFLRKADGDLENYSNVNVVSDYSVEKGILNFANSIGADLVAVATHGRRGLAHFFEGSISEDIANHSTLPVMTFKI